MLSREREARAIATRQQLILIRLPAAPHRADRMDHMLGRQAIALGDPRLAGRTAAKRAAFDEQEALLETYLLALGMRSAREAAE